MQHTWEEMRNLNNIVMVKFVRQGRSGNLDVFICGLCRNIFNVSNYTASSNNIFLLNNELGKREKEEIVAR
jgi:hypothetical protein